MAWALEGLFAFTLTAPMVFRVWGLGLGFRNEG